MKRKYQTNIIELKRVLKENELDQIWKLEEVTGIKKGILEKVLNGEEQPDTKVMDLLIQVLNLQPAEAGELFFSRI